MRFCDVNSGNKKQEKKSTIYTPYHTFSHKHTGEKNTNKLQLTNNK